MKYRYTTYSHSVYKLVVEEAYLRVLRLATIQVGLFTPQALSLLSLPSHSTEHGWKKGRETWRGCHLHCFLRGF